MLKTKFFQLVQDTRDYSEHVIKKDDALEMWVVFTIAFVVGVIVSYYRATHP